MTARPPVGVRYWNWRWPCEKTPPDGSEASIAAAAGALLKSWRSSSPSSTGRAFLAGFLREFDGWRGIAVLPMTGFILI